MQGVNSFGRTGYGGPMPPVGHGLHHYIFSLYALRRNLELDPGLTKAELIEEMRGDVIEIAKLVGTYERSVARRAG
jgi:Raf kinase inhibitor-like YbhB/YbcL family protein